MNEDKNSNSIWFGTYLNSEDAMRVANQLSSVDDSAFQSNRWISRQAEMFNSARMGRMARHSSLPMLIALLQNMHAPQVYDFGGRERLDL